MGKAGDKPTTKSLLDLPESAEPPLTPKKSVEVLHWMVKSGARTMSEYFKKERQEQQRLAKLTFAAAAPADKPTPKKRRRPKSGPAIALLKEMYPPDGRPSEDVSNSALDRKYREECDKREIHKHDRVSPSQLLRCVGRKDEKKK